VWIDANEQFHIAFRGGTGREAFSIRVVTDGVLEDVRAVGGSGELPIERHETSFELRTMAKQGTLRFEIEAGNQVMVLFRYDGRSAPVREIGLGPRALPPERNPVSLRRDKAILPDPKHDHPKGDHHHHVHKHPHELSEHHHHPHQHPHGVSHAHHPH
jgi:hypothetical protein